MFVVPEFTSNFALGFVSPIPTFPEESIRILSVPAGLKRKLFEASKYKSPVLEAAL